MYATLRRAKVHQDMLEDGLERIKNGVTVLRDLPGFVAYYWVKVADDEVISISIFENPPEMTQSNQIAADWAKTKLSAHMQGQLEMQAMGEVMFHMEKLTDLPTTGALPQTALPTTGQLSTSSAPIEAKQAENA